MHFEHIDLTFCMLRHFQKYRLFFGKLFKYNRSLSLFRLHCISLLFVVRWHGVYDTTLQRKCNFNDQIERSSPQDRRHLQTARFKTPIYMNF